MVAKIKKLWSRFFGRKDLPGRMSWTEWGDRVKNADFKIKEITDQNKLILTFAKRRTGKTYDDADDIIRSMEKGEYNAANYDFNVPPWVDPKFFIRFHHISEVCFIPRIRIHIDEATADFDCHDWASVSPAIRRWLSEVGKYMQCVRTIVQVARQIDVSFAQQMDEVYSLSRFWRIIHKTKWERVIDNPNISPPWEPEGILSQLLHIWRRFVFMRSRGFALFNTYQHFMTKNGMSKKEQQKVMIEAFNKSIEGSVVVSKNEAIKFLNG